MALLSDQEFALRDLICTMPAATLADAVVQIGCAALMQRAWTATTGKQRRRTPQRCSASWLASYRCWRKLQASTWSRSTGSSSSGCGPAGSATWSTRREPPHPQPDPADRLAWSLLTDVLGRASA